MSSCASSAHSPTRTAMPASRRRANPAPFTRGLGSVDGRADLGDSGVDDGLCAGRCPAVVGVRLERGVQYRARCPASRAAQRLDLRVRPSGRLRVALADDHALAHDDRADGGVGANRARRAARQLYGPLHVGHGLMVWSGEARTRTRPSGPLSTLIRGFQSQATPEYRCVRDRMGIGP